MGSANLPEKVSRDMGYRSDSIAVSRDMGPLSTKIIGEFPALWARISFLCLGVFSLSAGVVRLAQYNDKSFSWIGPLSRTLVSNRQV